jgi:prepilin-type N-terminal cleavage/methylation domain-containing protein
MAGRTTAIPIPSQGGFSLIEMLIVVTLIGVSAAYLATKLDVAHYQIDGAMQSIGYTLMGAQREAVAQQHDVIVTFNTATRAITVIDDTNNNRTADVGEHTRTFTLDNSVQFGHASASTLSFGSSAISFTQTVGGLPALTFHRNGSASQDGGIYLTSTRAATGEAAKQRDTRAIVIDRPTGRVEWWRYNGSSWLQGF